MKKMLYAAIAAALALPVLAENKTPPPPTQEKIDKIKAALPAKCEPPAKARKILLFHLTEGFVHGSIPVGNECFKLLGEKTGAYTTTPSVNKDDLLPESLKQYDAVMFNNTTRLNLTDAQSKSVLEFVRNGGGLIGIHAASDNFYCCKDVSDMLGGQFDGHPWGAGGTWAFKLDDPNNAVNRAFGGKGFVISDEIYQIKGAYNRDSHRELVSLDMSDARNMKVNTNQIHRTDGDFPVTWIKPFGKGRVFYCSMGHNEHMYWTPYIVQHYLDGIQYALGDLKADDRPTNVALKEAK